MNSCLEPALNQRFPKRADVLFKPTRGPGRGLVTDPLGFRNFNGHSKYSEGWHLYEHGYKQAADMLCQKTLDEGPVHTLVFPIVFLYRHYIELSLKLLLLDASRFMADVSEPQHNHDLRTLWKEARKILPAVWPEVQPEQVEAAEACIIEMSEHDPGSMAFRYPFDKKSDLHLEKLHSVDLRNLKDVMDGIGNFLWCLGEAIAQQLEFRGGMDSF
jgi:hypothetical protein